MINRRHFVAGGAVAAVALAGGAAVVDAKFKTVTKTFSNTTSITLPGSGIATPYPSTITVSGFKQGKIQKVRVFLNGYNYNVPDDIDILLSASQLPGVNTILMSDVGSAVAVANVNLILDDAAATALPDLGPLVSGTYKPADYNGSPDTWPSPAPAPSGAVSLGVFNGANPNGDWQLWVNDWMGNGPGNIAGGWSIEITAQVKVKKKKHKKH